MLSQQTENNLKQILGSGSIFQMVVQQINNDKAHVQMAATAAERKGGIRASIALKCVEIARQDIPFNDLDTEEVAAEKSQKVTAWAVREANNMLAALGREEEIDRLAFEKQFNPPAPQNPAKQ